MEKVLPISEKTVSYNLPPPEHFPRSLSRREFSDTKNSQIEED